MIILHNFSQLRLKRLLIALTFLVTGCENHKPDIFNEADYFNVRTDTDQHITYRRVLMNKYDTSRGIIINYWNNGNILAKSFVYNGKLDGATKIYGIDGKLENVMIFKNGKKVSDTNFVKVDTSLKIFRNGKFEKFTSIDSFK